LVKKFNLGLKFAERVKLDATEMKKDVRKASFQYVIKKE